LEKQPLKLKKKLLSSRQRASKHFQLGQDGESRAARFLVSSGYEVWEQNLQIGRVEVDIVAFDPKNKEIVFVEVKTRSTEFYGSPSGAVNSKKLRNMQRVAAAYIQAKDLNWEYRFDILAVLPGTIHHYQQVSWDR